jgi:hypothetical protein
MTAAHISSLVAKRKFVSQVVRDTRRSPKSNEKVLIWNLRFADMRERPIPLQFHARLETALSGLDAVRPKPGMSLKWQGIRIRGVNWNFRHDNMLNGVAVPPVRGWHEKVWTDQDEDRHLIDINGVVKNTDFHSMIRFCCKRWNIDYPAELQIKLGEDQ